MKTKFLKHGLILVVVISMFLSACTQATTPAADSGNTENSNNASAAKLEGKLNLLSNWDSESEPKGAVLKQVIDDFMAANPGVEVTLEIVPDTDIATKVETSFLANQEPDIILHNWMGPSKEWLPDGVVVPVNSYLSEWGLEGKFKANALNDFKVGNDYGAFPIEGFNWPMWYNLEILEKAGVTELPTTFAELTQAAAKVREAGYQPFALGGNDWTGGDWFLTVATAALGNDQAAELFANGGFSQNADARKFVEEFVQMRDAGVFVDNAEGMEFETMNAAFFEGKAAMMHGGSWSYADIPAEMAEKVKLGGIPLPAVAKGAAKPYWYSSFEAKGLWITRNGQKNLDIVKAFTMMFFQDQYMTQFVEKAAMIPPFNQVDVDESVLSPLFVQSLTLDVDTVKHASVAYAPTSTFDAWYDVTANAFVPGTTADEILTAMDVLYK